MSAPNSKNLFRHQLSSGATLVGEFLPEYASAAIGIWIKSGSRDEPRQQEGAAHFVEHMVFKGTKTRSAKDIALSLENVGGYLEAFTTKESTCFYARSLSRDQGLATQVLSDLASQPLFSPSDLARERTVILEEYHQVEDTPEELVGDLAMARLWPNHVMGSSILGSVNSIQNMQVEWVRDFHQRHYVGPNIVVGAVGNVDPAVVVDLLEEHLIVPDRQAPILRTHPVPAPAGITWVEKNSSQLYICMAAAAPSRNHPERYATQLMIDILGGGMSSRLFQSIREESGLVYSVQGYSEHFLDTGVLSISLGVSPENTSEALRRLREEMYTMAAQGPTPEELQAAKSSVRGSILMGRESLSQRMLSLAGMEAEGRWYETVEESVAKYEAVTLEAVHAAASSLLNMDDHHLVVVGPAEASTLEPFKRKSIHILESRS